MSRLETVLRALPEAVDWPEPSPQLASRVTARIDSGEQVGGLGFRRWAIAAAIALTLLVGLVPGTRQAVADLFQQAGVLIGFVEETPTDLAESLDLGDRVTLTEADRRATFDLVTPAVLGSTDAVYVDDGLVSMVWDGPVLLTQRSGDEPFAEKGVGPETQATSVTVNDNSGIWIEGAEHSFTLLDEEGSPTEETSRLAANVLLWSADGVDYRLELTGSLDEAIAISESLRAIE